MKTPDLVFRGRRLSSDRALVLAKVQPLPSAGARETIRRAEGEGADLVVIDDGLPALVEWARSTFPGLVVGVATDQVEVALAACAAGAELIDARGPLSQVAVKFGAGYVGSDVADAAALGVSRDGLVLDGGVVSSLPLADGGPVAVDVPGDGTPGGLAVAALAASAGVTIIRTSHVRSTRHAVEMAASIAGTRPPAKAVRWE